MAEEEISITVEQRIIIKFLVNEGCKSGEIRSRLLAQFGNNAFAQRTVNKWCKRFRDGRTSTDDDPRSGAPCTAIAPSIVKRVEEAIFVNPNISIRELVNQIGISCGSIERIILSNKKLRRLRGVRTRGYKSKKSTQKEELDVRNKGRSVDDSTTIIDISDQDHYLNSGGHMLQGHIIL